MQNMMPGSGGFTPVKLSNLTGSAGATEDRSYIWNTEKIDLLIFEINNGIKDIRKLKSTPFKDNDINLKRENLPFEYTPFERKEIAKCKNNLIYFVTNYCIIQTNDGRMLVKDAGGLRKYQPQLLNSFNNEPLNILMASRQTGKTVTSALFMLWFLLFHSDKTALAVADNFTTTKELLDKFKISLEGLPFFMKPGIDVINASQVKFDNDSRLVGRTTTKKSGIGLSVNLLYIDEFAHINEANLNAFYRAIFPTVTADPNGKIIITSTPNGKNKFWEIWKDAISKTSSYTPLRVDWWQVDGRGDEWKRKTIADLGSEEDFNQEYGLQFYASDRLLLNSKDLKRLDLIKSDYVQSNLILDEHLSQYNEYLYLHKKYANYTVEDFRTDKANYIFSIDTSDGGGGDYSVINIFKVIALPVELLKRKKEIIKNELDVISLVQVGYFRSNSVPIDEFIIVGEHLIYKIFNPDNTRILIELNHKGETVLNHFRENIDFWDSQIVHTKHTQAAIKYKQGLKLGPSNKIKYCEKFKYLVMINRIIPNDHATVEELQQFGRAKGGTYRAQNGNDDLAMSSVNVSALFDSSQFWDIAVDTFERSGEEYLKALNDDIFGIDDNRNKSKYNYSKIKDMNEMLNSDTSKKTSHSIIDLSTLNQMAEVKDKFFGKN